ncbi:unnamed protein product [Cylicostephanus goldi]|uniref:Uncharacterized protein n=1 Tax=Cylicostephanus goldi TaxID=71465 RepID=A0A3P7RB84_CYLGO|nr:unnamed protein product [Cylicostephanus goldi]
MVFVLTNRSVISREKALAKKGSPKTSGSGGGTIPAGPKPGYDDGGRAAGGYDDSRGMMGGGGGGPAPRAGGGGGSMWRNMATSIGGAGIGSMLGNLISGRGMTLVK